MGVVPRTTRVRPPGGSGGLCSPFVLAVLVVVLGVARAFLAGTPPAGRLPHRPTVAPGPMTTLRSTPTKPFVPCSVCGQPCTLSTFLWNAAHLGRVLVAHRLKEFRHQVPRGAEAGSPAREDDDDAEDTNNRDKEEWLRDIEWRVQRSRLDHYRTKEILRRKPCYLPYKEAKKWVQRMGLWETEREWKEWLASGEKRNPYIPNKPDVYYGDAFKGWDDFLCGRRSEDDDDDAECDPDEYEGVIEAVVAQASKRPPPHEPPPPSSGRSS